MIAGASGPVGELAAAVMVACLEACLTKQLAAGVHVVGGRLARPAGDVAASRRAGRAACRSSPVSPDRLPGRSACPDTVGLVSDMSTRSDDPVAARGPHAWWSPAAASCSTGSIAIPTPTRPIVLLVARLDGQRRPPVLHGLRGAGRALLVRRHRPPRSRSWLALRSPFELEDVADDAAALVEAPRCRPGDHRRILDGWADQHAAGPSPSATSSAASSSRPPRWSGAASRWERVRWRTVHLIGPMLRSMAYQRLLSKGLRRLLGPGQLAAGLRAVAQRRAAS